MSSYIQNNMIERRKSPRRRVLNEKTKLVVRITYRWYHKAAPLVLLGMALYLVFHYAKR